MLVTTSTDLCFISEPCSLNYYHFEVGSVDLKYLYFLLRSVFVLGIFKNYKEIANLFVLNVKYLLDFYSYYTKYIYIDFYNRVTSMMVSVSYTNIYFIYFN